MKKLLITLLVCMAVMSLAVYAELPTYTPDETDGTYTIGYTEGAASNYYALLVVEGIYEEGATPVISEDTVLYIDQATADSNGDVSFGGWIPKNDEPATVYLGGKDATPVLLGYLGENTFVISGTVSTDSGTTYEATVTLTDAEGGVFTATSVSGAYSVEVPEGTYTFTVNVKNHLSYTDADFAVTADVSDKNASLKGGDIDANGTVEFNDLGAVLDAYKLTDESVDIDGAGTVDFADLGIILDNYKATAVNE